jgi:hypothetical protein
MERSVWTDERLDDLAQRMDTGFDRVDRDIRDLRAEMGQGFAGVRGEIEALRVTLLRIGGGMMVGLVGVIAAVLASA